MTYINLLNRLNSYSLALTTMNFDSQTIAPEDGAQYRNKAMAILSGEHFKLLTSEQTHQILLENEENDDYIVAESVKQQLEQLNKIKNIPQDVYISYQQLKNNAQTIWEDAKNKKNYEIFKPTLIELINTSEEVIDFRNSKLDTYVQMLGDYEKGLSVEIVDDFFETIKKELVPFIDEVLKHQPKKPDFLSAFVSKEKQVEISKLIMDHLSYSDSFGYLGEAAHPFSSTFSINDTRITTAYDENDFTSNIFSVIHEVGHSLYNHNVNPAFEGYPIANSMSFSMHESQSRFLENNIGRSKSFWNPIYGKLQSIIPEVLLNVELDEFIQGINYVEKSPIRIEADELTYPLHIMIRYELERKMFEDGSNIDDLDEEFADLMENYLGIRPEDDAHGVLQDVHWSNASFGYFPTYALGSAYAAQFMYAMKDDINLDSQLMIGDLTPMFEWLKNEIHTYGGYYQAETVLKKATGESFNPNYYVRYLKEKYSKLLSI